MTRTPIKMLASAALVTGVASLAFTGPASAKPVGPVPPGGGPAHSTYTGTHGADGTTDWLDIGVGAVGGVALAGLGAAVSSSLRRQRQTFRPQAASGR